VTLLNSENLSGMDYFEFWSNMLNVSDFSKSFSIIIANNHKIMNCLNLIKRTIKRCMEVGGCEEIGSCKENGLFSLICDSRDFSYIYGLFESD
jgi:hypothetical protein